jgi:orotidine-5'-phosphate decarboxylase
VSFGERIKQASERNRSRIVVALDLEDPNLEELARRSKVVLEKVHEYVCAVKINRQLVLSLGLRGVETIVRLAQEHSLPTIMDAKLNDVAHTNEFMMRAYMETGFDAVIASPVAGWEGGLDGVFKLAVANMKGVILLVYMSNPGAKTFYSLNGSRNGERPRPVFELLTQLATEWKAHGVVVGATQPEIISRVRELAGPTTAIYSPGVGAQGGDPKKALAAGSDYLIVGRAIYQAEDPERAAKEMRMATS